MLRVQPSAIHKQIIEGGKTMITCKQCGKLSGKEIKSDHWICSDCKMSASALKKELDETHNIDKDPDGKETKHQ